MYSTRLSKKKKRARAGYEVADECRLRAFRRNRMGHDSGLLRTGACCTHQIAGRELLYIFAVTNNRFWLLPASTTARGVYRD